MIDERGDDDVVKKIVPRQVNESDRVALAKYRAGISNPGQAEKLFEKPCA